MQLMVKATLLLALCCLPTTALAADYYFSDCDAGYISGGPGEGCGLSLANSTGSACDHDLGHVGQCGCAKSNWDVPDNLGQPGTWPNPWCLAPEPSGLRDSFEEMMDGGTGTALTTDLVAGDRILLCAGFCDGTSTAVFHLQSHDAYQNSESCGSPTARSVFDYQANGPIAIEPYCIGSSCETVVLDGDADADNTYDSGEATHLVNTGSCVAGVFSGKGDYIWDGDPPNTGTAHIIVQKAVTALVYDQGLPSGKTNLYKGLELRYQGDTLFPCTGDDCDNVANDGVGVTPGAGSVGCVQFDSGAFVVTRELGTVTMTKGRYHHLCFAALRSNNNCNGTQASGCTDGVTALNFTDNEIWNAGAVTNSHQARNALFARNYAHDTQWGIGFEEQYVDSRIEDNRVACLGEYDVNSTGGEVGKCTVGIEVTDGDNPPSDGCADVGGNEGVCTTTNVIVQRNKVYQAGNGKFTTGIKFVAHNSSGTLGTSAVVNNMVWNVQKSSSCTSGDAETSLAVLSVDPVLVESNTVYGSKCPVTLGGAAHTFIDNLVTSGVNSEFLVTASAASSDITYNVLYDTSGTIATVNGAAYSCATVPTIQNNNRCSACAFAALPTGPASNWDLSAVLHLSPSDAVCRNTGTSGPTDDIDRQDRTGVTAGVTDVGADEILTSQIINPPMLMAVFGEEDTCHP